MGHPLGEKRKVLALVYPTVLAASSGGDPEPLQEESWPPARPRPLPDKGHEGKDVKVMDCA